MYKRYFESIDVTPKDSFIKELLAIQDQVKIFHWQTDSYASHMALGDYYDALSPLIDQFVEEYQGQFGRVPIKANPGQSNIIGLSDIETGKVEVFVENIHKWFVQLRRNVEGKSDTTNLQNILDEIIGETSKLKYLLTLQ